MRRILVVFVLISLFLPSLILGEEINCEKYKNTCPSADLIEKIEKECPEEILSSIYNTCQKEKEEIEKEKQEKEQKLKEIEKEESSTKYLVSRINRDLSYLNAQVNYLSLSIYQLQKEIKKREKDLKELEKALSYQKKLLRSLLKEVYFVSLTNPVEIFLDGSLSEFSFKIAERDALQRKLQESVKEIQKAKKEIEKEKENLIRKKEEKEKYKLSLELSRQNLSLRKKQKEYLLAKFKEAKTPLEKEIISLQWQLDQLRKNIQKITGFLSITLGRTVSWSEIIEAVEYASQKEKVDKFLLLAVLMKETNLATYQGINKGSLEENIQRCINFKIKEYSGYKKSGWPSWQVSDNVIRERATKKCSTKEGFVFPSGKRSKGLCNLASFSPSSHGSECEIFYWICRQYGLDPNKMPISPTWAMGPSQFEPSVWMKYGWPGNPWNLKDALVAMARKLKAGGVAGYNPGHPTYEGSVGWWRDWFHSIYNKCGGFDPENCADLKKLLERFEISH